MAERTTSDPVSGSTQLALLELPSVSWRLDEKTREVGRRGLAEARAALKNASGSERGEHRSPQAAEAA